jgi:hypothetical protein
LPTVLDINGYKVVIYTDDHTPAHVHVRKSGGLVKIQINCEPLELLDVWDLSEREIRTAFKNRGRASRNSAEEVE